MADIVLRDGSGNYQTYSGAKALGVDTVDGGIAVFVSEDAVPSNYDHPATHPASMISGLVVGDIPQLATAERDFTLDKELGCYAYEVPGAWEHALGDTYKVHWNGTDYTLVVKDFADVLAGVSNVHYMGNATKFLGLGMGEDTREPFVVALSTIDCTCVIMTDTVGPHTVGIEAPNTIKKLDAKYLPDGLATEKWVEQKISEIEVSGGSSSGGGSAEVDILPEQEIVLIPDAAENTENTKYLFLVDGDSALFSQLSKMKTGETYCVVLDGVEYTLPDKAASLMETVPEGVTINNFVLLGNSAFDIPGEDTGEPLCIILNDTSEQLDDGSTFITKQAIICVRSDIVGAESITCTLRIYQPGTADAVTWDDLTDKGAARTIKREYIPDPPFFDLTAMGFPALTPGADVEFECDASEICEAMAKGIVKFKVEMNSGNISLPFSVIGVPIGAMDTYASVTPVFFNEAIMTIHIEVTETLIIGRVRMLALTALS